MRWPASAAVAVCLAFAPVQAWVSDQLPSSANDVVVISGATDPGKLPLWIIWREAFRTLTDAQSSNLRLVMESLVLSDDERAKVLAEATAQSGRHQKCLERAEMIETHAAGRIDEAAERMSALVIACRQEVLDARDRLGLVLREKGLLILDAWAMDNASGITVTVPARELAQFMRPRFQ